MHVVDIQIVAIGLLKNTGGYDLTNISYAQLKLLSDQGIAHSRFKD
jgi:hypothetical protein